MPQLLETQEAWLGAYRVHTYLKTMAEANTVAELDAATFGNTTAIKEPGLFGYGFSGDGLWDPTLDGVLAGYERTRNVPFTLTRTTGAVGTRVRSVLGTLANLSFGGQHGELMKVMIGLGAMGTPVRGTILHNASATGNVTGTALNLGAVASGKSLYGALHVFSGTGNLVVKIQSDSVEAFNDDPQDRITFATVDTSAAQSYEWSVLAGPITHTWWRVVATNPNTRDFGVAGAIR